MKHHFKVNENPPLGYLNVKDANGKSAVILDTSRAFLIKKMFELYSLGNTSLGDLEKFAHQNNLTNNFFKGNAKPITKEVIRNIYKPIITPELFNHCQAITSQRARANNRIQAIQTAKEGKDFIFKSLITCGTTGRAVSSDRKENRTNKNTYLIARDPKNPNKKVFVKESDVLEEISQVFKALQFPKPMLDEITTHLKTSHQAEMEFHAQKIKELRKQQDNCKLKLNRLIDMTLNGLFTEEICKSKKAEIDKELKSIAVEIEMHDNADTHFKETLTTAFYLASKSYDLFICSKNDEKRRLINFVFIAVEIEMHDNADTHFKETLTTAFYLASKSYDLFICSKNDEKRRLINFVFSNIQLTGKNVSYTLRCPFDIMAKMNHNEDWLPGRDSNPRPID